MLTFITLLISNCIRNPLRNILLMKAAYDQNSLPIPIFCLVFHLFPLCLPTISYWQHNTGIGQHFRNLLPFSTTPLGSLLFRNICVKLPIKL